MCPSGPVIFETHNEEALKLLADAERLRSLSSSTLESGKILSMLTRAFELGLAEAGLSIAHLLATETKDSSGALEWYKKSCDAGCSMACFSLGQIYAFGMLDQEVDSELAHELFARANDLLERGKPLTRKAGLDPSSS